MHARTHTRARTHSVHSAFPLWYIKFMYTACSRCVHTEFTPASCSQRVHAVCRLCSRHVHVHSVFTACLLLTLVVTPGVAVGRRPLWANHVGERGGDACAQGGQCLLVLISVHECSLVFWPITWWRLALIRGDSCAKGGQRFMRKSER